MNTGEAAIVEIEGSRVILVGAGKSHTIIKKINHLVEKKILDSDKILCLTFNNEASNSLSKNLG